VEAFFLSISLNNMSSKLESDVPQMFFQLRHLLYLQMDAKVLDSA